MRAFIYLIVIYFIGSFAPACIKLDPKRSNSQHYKDGRFRNIVPDEKMFQENSLLTNPREKFFKYKAMLMEIMGEGKSNTQLEEENNRLPKLKELKTQDLLAKPGEIRVMWLGHATNWIALHDKKQRIHIITDPLFNNVYRLHKRITKFPIAPKDLPSIDVVLISHAHPDHLDIKSLKKIQELNPKVRMFFPEGNAPFVKDEGIERPETLQWWQKIKVKGVEITFTPSHHWSRMAFNDKCQSHWGSYVIQTAKRRIFFSGDTGYSSHFKKIAERFPGGFDAALTEIRFQAYWSTRRSHLSPKEAIQANKELASKLILPIHWGTLPSNHSTPMGAITRLKHLITKDKQMKALFWHPGHQGLRLSL